MPAGRRTTGPSPRSIPHPNPFTFGNSFARGRFFFQGAADCRGAIPPPCSHYFNRATQSELLNAAVYRPHSSENSFLPAVNKTSRETPSANGRRSSGGSGAERCGHSAVSAPGRPASPPGITIPFRGLRGFSQGPEVILNTCAHLTAKAVTHSHGNHKPGKLCVVLILLSAQPQG